jgi:hypothetical protein
MEGILALWPLPLPSPPVKIVQASGETQRALVVYDSSRFSALAGRPKEVLETGPLG